MTPRRKRSTTHMPDKQTILSKTRLGGVRAIALLEAGKGLLALVAASGLMLFWNDDLQSLGKDLLRHLHLNPGRTQDHVIWDALTSTSRDHLHWIAIGVLCYALVRFVEAGGLWHDRRWAEWLGTLSGAIYIPFEIRELLLRPGLLSLTLLSLNILVVASLALRLSNKHRRLPADLK